jgi:hypothetical protein
MCKDSHYVLQHVAMQLAQAAGLYPMRFRYVELAIDGQPRGLYLLVEKSKETLLRQHLDVRAVLRRGQPTGGTEPFEAVHASDRDLAGAVNRAAALASDLGALSGDALLQASSDRIDLDQYLGWLAFSAALHNGDYSDEVWFTATGSVHAGGQPGERYHVTAWDLDDVLSACGGDQPFADPEQLTYCVESPLDRHLLADAAVYARYRQRLAELLAGELGAEKIAAAAATTRAQILPFLADPVVTGALEELLARIPAAADPATAQAEVTAELDQIEADLLARRTELLGRLPGAVALRRAPVPIVPAAAAAPR